VQLEVLGLLKNPMTSSVKKIISNKNCHGKIHNAVPMFNLATRQEGVWGSVGIAPRIHRLGNLDEGEKQKLLGNSIYYNKVCRHILYEAFCLMLELRASRRVRVVRGTYG
jgi:hypothetical protein